MTHAESERPPRRRILLVAANPATSPVTGWPVGFWWAELVHPWWTFTEAGYDVEIRSPDGGALVADSYSDPEDPSGYAADDLLSLGFKRSPRHAALLQATRSIADVDPTAWDALFVAGGQSPMITFRGHAALQRLVADMHDAGAFVGHRIQPFRIEEEARRIPGTNFIVHGRFAPFAVRDGRLVTGQQQFSGTAAARLVVEALGR